MQRIAMQPLGCLDDCLRPPTLTTGRKQQQLSEKNLIYVNILPKLSISDFLDHPGQPLREGRELPRTAFVL